MIKHKPIPNEMKYQFKKLDVAFDTFNDFFHKYAHGKRQRDGLDSLYVGSSNDITIFWLKEEEYPFAYVFPECYTESFKKGYFFYVRA